MKKTVMFLFFMVAAVMLFSCAGGPPAEVTYKEKAIHVNLTADSRLNLYDNSPHALVLCLYQLKDPNAFNQLVEEKGGLSKLLECSRFDPSVGTAKRIVIQPSQIEKQDIDRAEGARYIAIAAGYYAYKERPTRIYTVPSGGDEVFINLYLAPQMIQDKKGR